jgi:hypothetical protein
LDWSVLGIYLTGPDFVAALVVEISIVLDEGRVDVVYRGKGKDVRSYRVLILSV